jgi:hypothetical protein
MPQPKDKRRRQYTIDEKRRERTKRLYKLAKAKRLSDPKKLAEYRAKMKRWIYDWRRRNPEKYAAIIAAGHRRRLEMKIAKAGRPKPSHCDCCGKSGRKIVWDHDHATGEFRGWICSPCNTALGMVGDSREVLHKMIAYLNKRR